MWHKKPRCLVGRLTPLKKAPLEFSDSASLKAAAAQVPGDSERLAALSVRCGAGSPLPVRRDKHCCDHVQDQAPWSVLVLAANCFWAPAVELTTCTLPPVGAADLQRIVTRARNQHVSRSDGSVRVVLRAACR